MDILKWPLGLFSVKHRHLYRLARTAFAFLESRHGYKTSTRWSPFFRVIVYTNGVGVDDVAVEVVLDFFDFAVDVKIYKPALLRQPGAPLGYRDLTHPDLLVALSKVNIEAARDGEVMAAEIKQSATADQIQWMARMIEVQARYFEKWFDDIRRIWRQG